nr:c-type cytochrome [uncultured Acidovorax sp.]
MPTLSRSLLACCAALALALGGCNAGAPAAPTDADVRAAEARRPQDPQLAAKYERSCLLCHGVRSGAPLVGFEPAWKPRVAQGQATLLAHVREGFNAMPAMGLCTDCSDAELRQLIDFVIRGQ